MLGLCWKKNDLIPHHLFSKVDMGIGFDVMQPPNSHAHPTTHFGKEVHQVVPNLDHNNKWTIILIVWWPL